MSIWKYELMRFFKSQNVFKKTTTKAIINTNNNNNNDNDNNVNLQPLFVCCSKTSVSFFFFFHFHRLNLLSLRPQHAGAQMLADICLSRHPSENKAKRKPSEGDSTVMGTR